MSQNHNTFDGRQVTPIVIPPTTRPRVTYGRMAGKVGALLGMRGAKATAIASAIYRREGKPQFSLGKGAAKRVVMEFAIRTFGHDATPISAPSVPFYQSEQWRSVRYIALRASRGVCELCGTAPTVGHPLHVDHIKPRSKYPELELDPANLQVLCEDCNLGKSNTDQIDWRQKVS